MHADRTNRVLLVVLALVLIAAGGTGVAASFGVFGSTFQHSVLTDNPATRFIGRNVDWFWWAAAGLALVVVLLSLRWLFSLLFSTDRAGDLPIARGGGAGRTTLDHRALTSAVVDETELVRGVDSAKARLIGDTDDPELIVTARVRQDADLADVRRRIVDGPLTHARDATGRDDFAVRLDLVVSTQRSDRVS